MGLIVTSNSNSAKNIILEKLHNYKHYSNTKSESLEMLLNNIPILSKVDLQKYAEDNYNQFLQEGFVFSETSGTTGCPLPTPRNAIDFKWNTLNQMAAYKLHLQSGLDRIAILHPSILSPFIEASISALQLLNVGYVRIYPIPNVCDYERIISVLERYEVTAIMSTPSLLYKLLYECKKITGTFPKYLKKVLLTGEFISSYNLANMQNMLQAGAEVLPFVYGSSEAASLMYGLKDGGYIGFENDFVFEVIPQDHNSEPELELYDFSGLLLVTWLRPGLLPIIRYNTNDQVNVKINNNQTIFYPRGRIIEYPINLNERVKLDEIIYSSKQAIYNYKVFVDKSLSRIDIIMISDGNRYALDVYCKERVSQLFPNTEVNIHHNMGQFVDFSPQPKFDKYRIQP